PDDRQLAEFVSFSSNRLTSQFIASHLKKTSKLAQRIYKFRATSSRFHFTRRSIYGNGELPRRNITTPRFAVISPFATILSGEVPLQARYSIRKSPGPAECDRQVR